jgi:hypothetical protein
MDPHQSKFCARCGAALSPRGKFCSACGASTAVVTHPSVRPRIPLRRRLGWLWWTLAALAFGGGVWGMIDLAAFPPQLGKHPIRTTARARSIGINGLGGDPYVDYAYTVNGKTYTGWGTAQLGHEDVLGLEPGDLVAIEYEATAPSQSCTCDAREERDSRPYNIALGIAMILPLPILVVRALRRRFQLRQRRADDDASAS